MEYKEEELKTQGQYIPSDKEREVINRVYRRFCDMREARDQKRHEFDNRTIIEYVNYSVDAWNGIVSEDVKRTKEDWQSLIWDHETRGKVKAVVAMAVGAKPFMSLIGESELDHEFSSDMMEVYEDSWKKENGSYKLYLQVLSAVVKGTVIVEELYQEEKYKVKEITKVDKETGQVSFVEKEKIRGGYGQVKAEIVPLLDFYPNENSADIKHDCAVLKRYSMKDFMNNFRKHPNAELVKAGIWGGDFDGVEYKTITSKKEEMVEVLKYYNEDFDEFVILANGLWLNKQKDDEISPIPFDHHRLPFAKTVNELADEECFYGKSFPDILGGEQETRNALLRLMVDQEILAVNRPMLLGSGIEIESYQLYPGKTINMPGDLNQIRELNISGSNQSAFMLLNMLRSSTDVNTSVDPTAQGVHQGRKTAREAVILDENAKRMIGTLQVFIYKLLYDRAMLRIENIKQFYTTPVQYSVLKDKYGSPVRNSEGKEIGKKPMYRKIPVIKPGQHPKWIDINPKMKGVNFQIRMVEDYELSMNRSTRIELAKAVLDEAKANPLMSADEATIEYLESVGKNPDKFYIKPTKEAIDFKNNNTVPQENQLTTN